ncbi:hypothetical protein CHH59_21460 [Shouchella clausii]|uniref:Uncharacterized protein n=1 Tax=Shouchella clausii TaxID=79880 RepID=A0A268NT49_SHOCL|nr:MULTISPECIES: hypothetical protein [Bacillaceae]PAE14712.1 hypothetical protein CHH91_17835 [Virgibacillus sp. 7505]PAE86654.1 hypothetical protein CHH72_22340 [Shouchella clausii]PAF11840.1 hypothetical protein CHH59_21460 [Shouchella clausii]
MNFVEKILDAFNKLGQFLKGMFERIIDFFLVPLSWLLYILEGILHFIVVLFQVVVEIIMIFVALFQFLFAITAGFLRTVFQMINPRIGSPGFFPSESGRGFNVVFDLVSGTGLLTVVPAVATFFLWFFFIIKYIALFGGTIMVRPFGGGGD